jgi:predicted AlkP superfamily phosphohydrolase/phosphomutase
MILIVGLDGATLDLVEPWVADGTLPALGRLMGASAFGRLASTVPPATFPSWTSFMTGVNPGRHGVFDFTRREPGAYRVRFVNATFRRAPSIWRLLSAAGRRVCVIGVPGTYPPEPVNGCMISGFDTPVTTRADSSFIYPSDLAGEVREAGGFPFADFQEFSVGRGWHARALASMLSSIERKGQLAARLLRRERWDCFMLLLGESDTVAHHFWAFHDRFSPRAPAAGDGFRDAIRQVYVNLDRVIGQLCRQVPSAHVLVVSDHGFGGTGDTALFLNRWLEREGLLRWRVGGAGAPLMGAARRFAVRLVPERWQASFFRFAGGRVVNAIESRARFGGIDWGRTQAFSEELNYFPSIWLNLQGRDPAGRVAPQNYDRVCADLRARLLAWQDPIHRAPVVRHVWRRDEIYDGPYVDNAPDLILDLATPGGYSYVCLPSAGRSGEPLRRLDEKELSGGKLRGMSGSHRPDGLFILKGDGVMPGELRGCWIGDMAPTILSLCGLTPPAGWDGRVLPSLGGAAPMHAAAEERTSTSERPYGAGEEACLKERLAQLGYLD